MGISRSRSGFDEEGIFRCIFLACLSMVESDAYVFFFGRNGGIYYAVL